MKFYRQLLLILNIFCITVVAGCGKTPLLSDLSSNKLLVVIKGTYESNSPQPWVTPPLGADDPLVQDDSVINAKMDGFDRYPTAFMLDISDMELLDSNGDRHKFSSVRQSHAMSIEQNNLDPFFNGAGLILQNDDVPQKYYLALAILVRKMLFDNAMKYNTQAMDPALIPIDGAWNPTLFFDVFGELPLPAYNFNQLQPHSYYDTLRLENYLINRVFPIVIGIDGSQSVLTLRKDFPLPTVLEVRIVIKNFIKKYEIQNSDNTISGYLHYYALSDWLQDVQADETSIGGNLLATARWYTLGETGKISGTNNTGHDAHVIAIPHGADINNYTIPEINPPTLPPSGNLRKANPCNLPSSPGTFISEDISAYLDFLLRQEKYKNDWNVFFPGPGPAVLCDSFENFGIQWDAFQARAGAFSIPPLAVFVKAGDNYTIDTVSPGAYDVYISNVPVTGVAPYGQLYLDNQFIPVGGIPVTVGIGQEVTGINFL